MSRKSYAGTLNEVLAPMGFKREGMIWSRTVGTVLEEIDLQTSQIGGVTANLAAKDLATEALLLEAIPWKRPNAILPPYQRIGHLMGNYDRWWKNDPNGPTELTEAIRIHAPQYFEPRRSLEAQAYNFGRHSESLTRSSFPTRIYLALTLYRMGEVEEALAKLRQPPKSISPNALKEVESVLEWLLRQPPPSLVSPAP